MAAMDTVKLIIDKLANTKVSSIVGALKSIDRPTWIKLGIVIALSTFVGVFLVRPAYWGRAEVVKKLKGLDNQIMMVESLNIKKPELEKEKKEIGLLLKAIVRQLFVRNEVSQLTGKISKLAVQSKVEILSFKPIPTNKPFDGDYGTKYVKNRFAFTVEGGYHQVGKFVGLIEGFPKIININTISISANRKKPGVHISDITITAISLDPKALQKEAKGKK